MNLPNIGQAMSLGALYNAKTERYTGFSVFSDTIPEATVLSRDENAIYTKYIYSESYKEKFKAFEINGHLKLNILAGIIALNAQTKYLTSEKQSSHAIKVSLSYSVSTKFEEINILSNEVRKYIDWNTLTTTDATHIVTGIKWGAHMLCSFEHYLEEGESEKDVEGVLSSSFDIRGVDAGAGGGLAKGNSKSTKDMSINISIFGDIVPNADIHPTSCEEAVQLMRRMPDFIKGVNQGKGSVLEYCLVPIEHVRMHFKLEYSLESVFNTIKLDLVDKVECIFDVIVENRIRLTEISDEILKYGDYITDTEARRIRKAPKTFLQEERAFKGTLSKIVRDIQAGNEQVDALVELMEDFEAGYCSSFTVDEVIGGYRIHKNRISFISRCNKINIQVIPKGAEIANVLSPSASVKTYILYIPKSHDYATIEQTHDWHILRLLREDNSDSNSKFIICDESITPNAFKPIEINKLRIAKYHGSSKSDQDVYRASILLPTVRISSTKSLTQVEKVTLGGYKLRMPCPLSHDADCRSGILEWVCFRCEEILQYGYDEFVYCGCGKTRLGDCMFRCSSIEHGYQYVGLHEKSVQSIRGKVSPGDDEINILLLGETGVGKSTFINAFANYLRYDSLEAAEHEEMITLIQSSFYIQETKVNVGEFDRNERLKDGESSTQNCRSYVFPLSDDIKIRFIDTPGIGDTRGVTQDRINFSEILNYISGFDKINGICILIASDNSRLTTSFQFCIDELLMHLHKSAKDNILFTFTKTRSAWYTPGDAQVPLMKYIKDLKKRNGISIKFEPNTRFCFDNEAFRLYAALKQGIVFEAKTKEAFSASWTKSVEESRRLIKRVMELTPHRTEESVTLHTARSAILALAEPMAKVLGNITTEMSALHESELKARKHEISAEELRKRRITSCMDMDPIRLEQPRTVCTSVECITIVEGRTKFNKHCHKNCSLENISLNSISHPGLRNCAAIDDWGLCKHCGCRWEKHQHIIIDFTEVRKEKIDISVDEDYVKEQSKAVKMQLEIEKADARITILTTEREAIFQAQRIFAGFLLQNSIVVQNNGILAYIDMNIEHQKKVVQYTNDDTTLNSLILQRREYVAQIEVFERAIRDGSDSEKIEAKDVMSAKDALCQLEINGKALKYVLDCGKANRIQASHRETRVVNSHVTVGWGFSAAASSTMRSIKDMVLKKEIVEIGRV
ncbi:hypothetical protein BGX27_010220 [Mortierella sp. AM989]|nr:hypothetical protein BGX27_010220 [Mortierella sp. AM989]